MLDNLYTTIQENTQRFIDDFYDFGSFDELRSNYMKVNRGCCSSFGCNYSLSNDRVVPVFCDHWNCDRCRKLLILDLYSIVHNFVKEFGLNRHFVLTSSSRSYRDKRSFSDSYKDMAKSWNKLKMVLQYHYGKFSYIMFPRAQRDGYCHYHILLNKFIDVDFIREKVDKYKNMGWLRIKYNSDADFYLHSDFFKDHEYYIPFGRRHYTTSRDIGRVDLRVNKSDNRWKETNVHFEVYDKELMYKVINSRFARALPFDEYVKDFIKINNLDIDVGGYFEILNQR